MRYSILSSLIILFFFTACLEPREELPDEVIGMAPIYAQENWKEIHVQDPQSITNLGKLYYKTPYLYASERSRGIHVFDNSHPEAPEKIAFIKIAGNSDMAIRGNTLYANNVTDLVSLDISILDSIKLISRIENAFKFTETEFPEGYIGYFECVDPNLGEVIGWQETSLTKPQCWR